MRRGLFILLAVFLASPAWSQSELTLPFMDNVFQSTYVNPAAMPEHKVSIGLPGMSSISVGTTNTGFSYSDLVGRKTKDSTFLDIGQMIRRVSKKNFMYGGVSADLFSLRVRVKGIFFGLNVTENASVRFSYPKDLLDLAWNGSGQFIGSEAKLKSLGVDAVHYREYGFLVAKQTRSFIIGGRVKYLQGLSNVHLQTKGLGMSVGSDMYDLSVTADASLNTSGIPIDSSGNFTGNGSGYTRSYLTNLKNPGLGLDGAVTYICNSKWNFTFSFNNLGFIRWRDEVKNYNVHNGSQFSGVDVAKGYFGDSTQSFKDYADSLKQSFRYTETARKYTTWLVPHFYLMARYSLSRTTTVNGSLFFEKYKALRPGITLAVSQKVGRVLNVIVSYSVQYKRFNNLGLGLMIKPGPFQLYIVTDNILAPVNPLNAKSFNVRCGMNLVFGRIKGEDKQPFNLKKRDQ